MNVVGSPLTNERGGLQLSVVLAIVLGLGLAASAYLNIYQAQRSAQERKLMMGEITDLRYQVKKDAEAKKTSSGDSDPVATPEPTASPTPTPAAAAATPQPQVAAAATQTKTVNTPATLRAAPSQSSRNVLGGTTKVPAGTVVNVTGGASGSYTPVTVNGAAGYLLTAALN
jgi:hypothetical protein